MNLAFVKGVLWFAPGCASWSSMDMSHHALHDTEPGLLLGSMRQYRQSSGRLPNTCFSQHVFSIPHYSISLKVSVESPLWNTYLRIYLNSFAFNPCIFLSHTDLPPSTDMHTHTHTHCSMYILGKILSWRCGSRWIKTLQSLECNWEEKVNGSKIVCFALKMVAKYDIYSRGLWTTGRRQEKSIL